MYQKTKYLTIDTHSRASKWYMSYGSVQLRLGGVRSQRRNGYKNMILEIAGGAKNQMGSARSTCDQITVQLFTFNNTW